MRCSPDPEGNLSRAIDKIRQAAGQGAQVVCLQELFQNLYFCQQEETRQFDLAQTIPGPLTEGMSELARELGIVLLVPLFERRAAGIYHNSCVLMGPDGRMAGHYRKMHIPDDPGYYEKFYFTPGDLGFSAHTTPFGRVGMLICWDQWFPEAARLTVLSGAEILFYPTAIGWAEEDPEEVRRKQQQAWEIVQRGHAVANGVFVAAVNRVGREGAINFWGQSFVCDPFGQVLARASAQEEEILMVDCDLSRVEKVRRHWPFLRDRRIDAYAGLSRRFLDGR